MRMRMRTKMRMRNEKWEMRTELKINRKRFF